MIHLFLQYRFSLCASSKADAPTLPQTRPECLKFKATRRGFARLFITKYITLFTKVYWALHHSYDPTTTSTPCLPCGLAYLPCAFLPHSSGLALLYLSSASVSETRGFVFLRYLFGVLLWLHRKSFHFPPFPRFQVTRLLYTNPHKVYPTPKNCNRQIHLKVPPMPHLSWQGC